MGDDLTLRELYEARRLDEAWAEYERLLKTGPVTAEDHLTGGLTARLRGDLLRARQALERCLGEGPSGITLGKALMTYGVILREQGETCTAIEFLRQFLDRMHEYEELRPVAWGAGQHNLGMALRGARRYIEALVAYEHAIGEFHRENMTGFLRESLWSRAWVHCIMGDHVMATADLDEAEPLITDERSRWYQEIGRAYAQWVEGDGEGAIRRCQEIYGARASAPADVVSHAYWLSGHAALRLEQFELAEQMTTAALDWGAKASNDNRCMSDAQELRQAVYAARREKTQGA